MMCLCKLDKSIVAELGTQRHHRINLATQLCSKIHKVDERRQDWINQKDRMIEVKLQNLLYNINQ